MRASGTITLRATLFALLASLIGGVPGRAEQRPTAEDLEFFEKRVRPLLAENCWKCHGTQEQKGNLRLDSREAALKGGDTGPALVPRKPGESELIRAVSYDPTGYQMPPTGKLEQDAIDTLTEWVRRGAPWPLERSEPGTAAGAAFDIEARARHWSFQPVRRPDLPEIENAGWPTGPIDSFILTRLEDAGLPPAPAADKRTWLRRVTFDLAGLPPSREEAAEFLADDSPDAELKVVDRLLASPHYGERWARHWLDLVRFAETSGHEFDYDIPYAWRYRDYVVRALNADLPYDRFVVEHVAGDLLDEPRRHPTEGSNESILGTGFWWLGQGKHSPVDIRAEECDRFDNQIDVLGKAFLGLTIACARCHDHKFDPVSAADYYALAGYLQSTRRQIAFIDDERLKATQRRLTELKRTHRRDATQVADRAILHAIDGPAGELLVAEAAGVAALAKHSDRGAFRRAKAERLDRLRAVASAVAAAAAGTDTFDDFSGERYTKWSATGVAFGAGPSTAGDFVVGSGPEEPVREILPAGQAHSGRLSPRCLGVLRSETFTIDTPYIDYRVRRVGGRSSPGRKHRNGQIHLIVDGFHLIQEPLYGGLSVNTSNDGAFHWYRQDVSKLLGSRAHIEIEDEEPDGYIVVDHVLFTTGLRPPEPRNGLADEILADPAIDSRDALLDRCVRLARESVALWREGRLPTVEHANDRIALLNAILDAAALHTPPADGGTRERSASLFDEYRSVEAGFDPSRRAIAAVDGSSENEHLLVRGNHRKPAREVPRRFLEVFLQSDAQPSTLSPQPSSTPGSGRLDLARRVVDPHNPLTARVLVNRLWHHHFGRGIVPTVDNFGVLGEPPSNPDLLDWLAAEFVGRVEGQETRVESQTAETTDNGPRTTGAPRFSALNPQPFAWSLKRLHRAMVLSSTYRMSSAAGDPRAESADPENRLWHRMPVRRLEAEIIRDAMLAVSGRLDRRMAGESVLPYLTPFMEGRGRPPESGPLDGGGRRSLYLSVRRNFLTPMFQAFDYPTPLSTMGRRSVSNVPAQALALMNNPFVVQQADLWARRALAEAGQGASAEAIIGQLYQTAFTRAPSEVELAAALAFIEERSGGSPGGASPERWAELCHVLLNVKEFVFVY